MAESLCVKTSEKCFWAYGLLAPGPTEGPLGPVLPTHGTESSAQCSGPPGEWQVWLTAKGPRR
jgi:hypothetical protein